MKIWEGNKLRQYKLLEITTQYDQYLRKFYKIHDDIDGISYDELFNLIVEDNFGQSDFMHRYLGDMGIESKLIFYNNRNLQKKWNMDSKDCSFFDILLSQIKAFSPDVILISDMYVFSKNEIDVIKESLLPKKVKLVGYNYSILNNIFMQNASLYDQIYTGDSIYVNRMREYGLPAYLLRHAFEPDILNNLSECEKMNKICFSGSIMTGVDMHNNRLDMLDVMTKSEIPYVFYGNIYGAIQELIVSEKGKKYIGIIAGIAEKIKPEVFGTEYYSVLSQYNVCLNLHGAGAIDGAAGNMRMFEVTGIGSCLLTDEKKENSALFEKDKEIVIYKSFEEMTEKARWLIDNPQKARDIALAGQKKTLMNYTYKNKAEYLNEYIQRLLL